nr:hypothetical protein [Tanacetum cinerariifolium]
WYDGVDDDVVVTVVMVDSWRLRWFGWVGSHGGMEGDNKKNGGPVNGVEMVLSWCSVGSGRKLAEKIAGGGGRRRKVWRYMCV